LGPTIFNTPARMNNVATNTRPPIVRILANRSLPLGDGVVGTFIGLAG
jgi:hypothetical protein